MRFHVTTDVAAEPSAVFAVLSDYRQDPRWRRGVVTMDPQPPGPAHAGTMTDEVLRFAGVTTRTPGQVTQVVAGEFLAWQADGPRLAASGIRRVEPSPGGAHVTLETELQFHGAWRVLQPLVALVYRRQLARDLRCLKGLVEG